MMVIINSLVTKAYGNYLHFFQGQNDVSSGFMPSSDPTCNLIPNKPKDFTAFVNLVDFCRYFVI